MLLVRLTNASLAPIRRKILQDLLVHTVIATSKVAKRHSNQIRAE